MNFTLLSDQPTDAFLTAIVAAGITVRGWQQPHHYFNKRKTNRNTLKTERGWIDPRNVHSGYLSLATDGDAHTAWNAVLMFGEQHGIYVNNGGMMSE
jgi:hypothetical protein